MIVTSMLSVIIPWDLIIVPVRLDTLEMEEIALVITCSYSLFLYMTRICTKLNIVMERKSLQIKLFSLCVSTL